MTLAPKFAALAIAGVLGTLLAAVSPPLRADPASAPTISPVDSGKSGQAWLNRHSIWVDKLHQRLYAFEGQKLMLVAKCSTADHHRHWARGEHRYLTPSTPEGNYRIEWKSADHYSRPYHVRMYHALFFHDGDAIHATSQNEYSRLGRPASGGCVRLTAGKAKALYAWAREGDAVHVVHSLPRAWAKIVHLHDSASPLLHG